MPNVLTIIAKNDLSLVVKNSIKIMTDQLMEGIMFGSRKRSCQSIKKRVKLS
jgi:hypothetical protein